MSDRLLLEMLDHRWTNYTDEEREMVRDLCARRGHDYSLKVWGSRMWVCARCGEPGFEVPA